MPHLSLLPPVSALLLPCGPVPRCGHSLPGLAGSCVNLIQARFIREEEAQWRKRLHPISLQAGLQGVLIVIDAGGPAHYGQVVLGCIG